ncbi:MAG: sensor histidine kinase, partial [Bacteroidota bacterium]
LGMLIMSFSIVLFVFLYQRKLIKKKLENQEILDLLQQQEMKTAYALLEGQDKERKRIASELHDNLGSILSSLNMFSDAIQSNDQPKKIKEIADKISETSRLANQEVRKISHSLDSGLLKHFGLMAAINQLMEAIASSKKIKIELELQIEDQLDNEVGLEIYRIIQELVNNTLKHSECSKIRIDISHVEKEMSIIFYDNGIGFDPIKVQRGMGLNNIGKRVSKLNGGLSIESKPGKGSTFIIELPGI